MFVRWRKLEWVHSFFRDWGETQADELIHIHSGKHTLSLLLFMGYKVGFFHFVLLKTSPYISPFRHSRVRALLAFWDPPFNKIIHPAKHTCHASLIFIVKSLLVLQRNTIIIPLQRQMPELWPRKTCVPGPTVLVCLYLLSDGVKWLLPSLGMWKPVVWTVQTVTAMKREASPAHSNDRH